MSSETTWGCLYTKGYQKHPVPLLGVHAEGVICDHAARITLHQIYKNIEKDPLEIVYVFPLDDLGAVCSFEAYVGDKKIIGELMERKKAANKYDDAIAAGSGAYLMQQTAVDKSRLFIGNLPPGVECSIKITYVTELPQELDKLRFTLPTTIAPLYSPAGTTKEHLESIQPPHQPSVPYGLTIHFNTRMSSKISGITSPSHELKVDVKDTTAIVELASHITAMEKDLVILIAQAEPLMPRYWIEPIINQKSEVEGYAGMAVIYPSFTTGTQKTEFIFVVDQSGSMEGEQIANARRALQILLRSIPEGSKFNIVGFGDTFSKLFPQSEVYNESSFTKASEHVTKIKADKGGTEILPPLQAIFSEQVQEGYARQLFILTDGQVSNTQKVVELVQKTHREVPTMRVFSLGIGGDVDRGLVNGMARAGGGYSLYVLSGEKMESKIVAQLKASLQPSLDVEIDWGEVVTQAPKAPVVFDNSRLIVYAVGPTLNQRTPSAKIGVQGQAKSRSVTQPLNKQEFHDQFKTDFLQKLAAKAQIRDLEAAGGVIEDAIVNLSLKYQILSAFTSFIGMEERKEVVEGTMQIRHVVAAAPKMNTDFYDANERCVEEEDNDMMYCDDEEDECEYEADIPDGDEEGGGGGYYNAKGFRSASSESESEDEAKSKKNKGGDKLEEILFLQKFNGAWNLDEAFAKVLGIALKILKSNKPDTISEQTWATAIGIAYLEMNLQSQKSSWEMAAEKSRSLVMAVANGEEILKKAREVISSN